MSAFRVLIADDERLAREQLERLVARHASLELVGTAATGADAIRQIDQSKPDVVFLDIQMPGATGLEVVRRIRHRPRIIFTTAYQEHAVTAFELQALDYLLKPFGRRRFDRAVDRLLEEGKPSVAAVDAGLGEEPIEQLFVRDGRRTRRIPVESIVHIDAAGDYARIVVDDGSSLLASVRMKQIESRLDHRRFVRVHRSVIVNVDRIAELTDAGNGRRLLTLSDGSTCTASRAGVVLLRTALARRADLM